MKFLVTKGEEYAEEKPTFPQDSNAVDYAEKKAIWSKEYDQWDKRADIKTERDKFLAALFMDGWDKKRFGAVVRDLENDHALGNANYPGNLEAALQVLLLHSERKSGKPKGKGDANRDDDVKLSSHAGSAVKRDTRRQNVPVNLLIASMTTTRPNVMRIITTSRQRGITQHSLARTKNVRENTELGGIRRYAQNATTTVWSHVCAKECVGNHYTDSGPMNQITIRGGQGKTNVTRLKRMLQLLERNLYKYD